MPEGIVISDLRELGKSLTDVWPGVLGGPPAGCITKSPWRIELRAYQKTFTDDHRLLRCGENTPSETAEATNGVPPRAWRCEKKWLCPTCGYAAECREAKLYGKRLRGWMAQGHAAALLTLTQYHSIGDPLAILWNCGERGWTHVVRGSGWRRDRRVYGICGYVRVTEVIHNPQSGWHPHFHVVLLLERELEDDQLAGLEASLASRWMYGVRQSGGDAEPGGQDLRQLHPGEIRTSYLFKGTRFKLDDDDDYADVARTPFQILSDSRLPAHARDRELWQEYTGAVTCGRRMQVVPSKNLDTLCGIDPSTIS